MSDILKRKRVMLVEDDQDFVYLIQGMLEDDQRLKFVGVAPDAESGVRLAAECDPDLVLMDLNLSGGEMDGIGAGREIRLLTKAKVLLLTCYEDSELIIGASKRSFASGYIFKSQSQTLVDMVIRAASGRTPQETFIKELILNDLTSAERNVYDMMMGKNAQIRSSEKTIANQKTAIFKKLGLKNRQELEHIFKNYG